MYVWIYRNDAVCVVSNNVFVWIILIQGTLWRTDEHTREFRDSKFDDSCCSTLLKYSNIFNLQGALFKGTKRYSHPTMQCIVLGLLREKSFIITDFSIVGLASTTYRMSHEKQMIFRLLNFREKINNTMDFNPVVWWRSHFQGKLWHNERIKRLEVQNDILHWLCRVASFVRQHIFLAACSRDFSI